MNRIPPGRPGGGIVLADFFGVLVKASIGGVLALLTCALVLAIA